MIRFRNASIILLFLFCVFGVFFFIAFNNMLLSILCATLFSIIIMEIILRYIFKISVQSNALSSFFTPFIEEHPYLPYVYKTHSYIPMLPKNTYEFMNDDYSFPYIKTNNRGHLNGEHGDRYVSLTKKIGALRISTLGDSVAANYVRFNGDNHNFSVEIEKHLSSLMNQDVEVNNCAIGGYTTLDILVKFFIWRISL